MTAVPRRIFLGMHNTASYLSELEAGFAEIGCKTEHLSFDTSPSLRGYRRAPSALSQVVRSAWLWHGTKQNRRSLFLFSLLLRVYFLYCLLRCDVFVFTAGRSFFGPTDLKILKFFGKSTIFVFLGSDSRPCFINGVRTNSRRGFAPKRAISHSRSARDRLAVLTGLASAVIDNPAAGQMHARPFFSHNMVGFPNTLCARVPPPVTDYASDDGRQGLRPVRILHAPSMEAIKGTAMIEAMIETLRGEGLAIDFVPIRDMPNAVVLQELAQCDFVIDQCFSDVPLAGFASEAAAFGKPAVVGSYAAQELRRFAHDADLPTRFMVRPERMIDAVRELITDPDLRRSTGNAARAFVQANWSAAEVARRFLAIAAGTAPTEWLVDPSRIEYWQGCGVPEERTRAYIREMVEIGSPSVLNCLASPSLRQIILAEIGWPHAKADIASEHKK